MRISCPVIEIELDGDHGPVDSVEATCSRCSYTTESFGTSEASRKRCMALLHDGCPRGENNFYEEAE